MNSDTENSATTEEGTSPTSEGTSSPFESLTDEESDNTSESPIGSTSEESHNGERQTPIIPPLDLSFGEKEDEEEMETSGPQSDEEGEMEPMISLMRRIPNVRTDLHAMVPGPPQDSSTSSGDESPSKVEVLGEDEEEVEKILEEEEKEKKMVSWEDDVKKERNGGKKAPNECASQNEIALNDDEYVHPTTEQNSSGPSSSVQPATMISHLEGSQPPQEVVDVNETATTTKTRDDISNGRILIPLVSGTGWVRKMIFCVVVVVFLCILGVLCYVVFGHFLVGIMGGSFFFPMVGVTCVGLVIIAAIVIPICLATS